MKKHNYTEMAYEILDLCPTDISAAVEADPEKPVFVFQHEHVRDTVYGSSKSDGWGLETFTEVLSKYPQVVHISGHSHFPANDPRAIWQGNFTAVNDGGLGYFELAVDGTVGVADGTTSNGVLAADFANLRHDSDLHRAGGTRPRFLQAVRI